MNGFEIKVHLCNLYTIPCERINGQGYRDLAIIPQVTAQDIKASSTALTLSLMSNAFKVEDFCQKEYCGLFKVYE